MAFSMVGVKLPNGERVRATFRNDWSKAGFVRINGLTVSGDIQLDPKTSDYVFKPRGANAFLVQ